MQKILLLAIVAGTSTSNYIFGMQNDNPTTISRTVILDYSFRNSIGKFIPSTWPGNLDIIKITPIPDTEKISDNEEKLEIIKQKILDFQKENPNTNIVLKLSNHNISKLPVHFFDKMTNIIALDLSKNKLCYLPTSLIMLVNLYRLDLSYNNFTDNKGLDEIGLLLSLQELNLQYNKISQLPGGMSALSNLQVLDVSYNPDLDLDYFLNIIQHLYALTEIRIILPGENRLSLEHPIIKFLQQRRLTLSF